MRDNILLILRSGINPRDKFLIDKQTIKDQQSKHLMPPKFLIENSGILHIRLGNRVVSLSAPEAIELRNFLESTQHVLRSEA